MPVPHLRCVCVLPCSTRRRPQQDHCSNVCVSVGPQLCNHAPPNPPHVQRTRATVPVDVLGSSALHSERLSWGTGAPGVACYFPDDGHKPISKRCPRAGQQTSKPAGRYPFFFAASNSDACETATCARKYLEALCLAEPCAVVGTCHCGVSWSRMMKNLCSRRSSDWQ